MDDKTFFKVFGGSIILALVLLVTMLSCNPARADNYMKLTAGPTKFTPSGVWSDTANGYQAIMDSSPMMSVGIGVSRKWYNLEYGVIYLGKHELDALWGNPDDFENSKSYPTWVGVQSGQVNGLYFNASPKLAFSGGDVHLNLGALYYKATWRGDLRVPGETHAQKFTVGPRMTTKQFGWFVGVGGTLGDGKSIRYRMDLNHYPVSVDGAKYKSSWSGGGGYKSVTALEFSVVVYVR